MRISIVLLILTIMAISACKKDTNMPIKINAGMEYMPMRMGTTWYYEVDSFTYSPSVANTHIDSAYYQVKEIVVDSFFNTIGNLVYVLDRYERRLGEIYWNFKTVNSAQFSNQNFTRTEGNNAFILFPLPPAKSMRWSGTALLDKSQLNDIGGESIEVFKGWESQIIQSGLSYNNTWLNSDDCFKVRIADSESLIDLRSGYEIYAKGFGLMFRELKVLDTQCNGNPINCKDIPWEMKAEKGFIVKQSLTGFQY